MDYSVSKDVNESCCLLLGYFFCPVIYKYRELATEGWYTEDKWKELLCCIVHRCLVLSLLWDVIVLLTVLLDFRRLVHMH